MKNRTEFQQGRGGEELRIMNNINRGEALLSLSREELVTSINIVPYVFSRDELIIQQKEPTCSVDSLLFNYACAGVSPKSFTKITHAISSASTLEKLVEFAIVMVSVPLVLIV